MNAYVLSEEHWTGPHQPVSTSTPMPADAVYPGGVAPDYVTHFAEHLRSWRAETGMLSSIEDKVMHTDFQAILRIGRGAVPLIIRELRQRPDFLFLALNSLVPESDVVAFQGSPSQTIDAWLRWAERNHVAPH